MMKQQNLDTDPGGGTPEVVLLSSVPLGLLKLFPTPLQKQSETLGRADSKSGSKAS